MSTETKAIPKKLEDQIKAVLEEMRKRMTGTNPRAGGTISTNIDTAQRFLRWLGKVKFARSDVDRYISHRRTQGISETTIRREFFNIHNIAIIQGLPWEFTKFDVPRKPKGEDVTTHPALRPEQVEQLIAAQEKYSNAERFYLAISTTFACRRRALALIRKRDHDENTILIRAVHGSNAVRHLIPEILKPLFEKYPPKEHSETALSLMVRRIFRKAELDPGKGYGWHSIRECLTSLAEHFLKQTQYPASIFADFAGWSKETKGRRFFDSAMMGHYTHSEVMNDDPYWIDRAIYSVHPFLKAWEKALAKKRKKV